MTAIAAFRRPVGAFAGKRRLRSAFATLSFFVASPAAAQLAGSIAVESDYRIRGYSLSDEHPAASAQLSYDHYSGAYLNFAALTELGDEFRFMGVQGNIGYARRLSPKVTLDIGLLRSQIRASSYYEQPYRYTEAYLGLGVGPVLGRVSYSPDYRHHGVSTLYGELEAGFEPKTNWRLSGHVGALHYLTSAPYRSKGSTHKDWRLTVSRQLGKFELHSSLSGSGPGAIYYGYRMHEKTALTVGGSYSF